MPVEFQQATLDNGLTIVAETDPDAHTAACGFFVKTGARDEKSEVMGVSHFLEHMMFKGTERRSADDVNREFDEIGAKYNAFTTSEMTAFHAHVLPEMLPMATDILADILRPALREADFDDEKKVILEEIAMYKDEPFWTLYEELTARRFGDHPLAHRVLGTNETITAMTAPQMKGYFTERYAADNTVVSFAGRVRFEDAVDQVRAACAGWSASGTHRSLGSPSFRDETFTLTDENVSRCYMLMSAEAPAMQDPRRYAATLLSLALGDSGNSKLHWSLIEPGLADEAQAFYDPHDATGVFSVFATCDPDRADDVWSVLERETDAIAQTITADDLERLRNKLATSVTLAGERPDGRMQRLGKLWTYLASHRTLEQELESINAVTLGDIHALCEAFPLRPRTVGRLMPG
ncbi:MAG: insulinase family protein [Phycisphaeraceae bacterium]|nr:insulinase family protein [Phycisphaeraceae bacterium]MCB9846990.1 insulinase family protein [Phycisphaeraceae bacterium]